MGRLTPAVRGLLIANGLVFVIQLGVRALFPAFNLDSLFGLVPADLFGRWRLWQLVTYMFLHGGFLHLLFNMLGLFVFGPDIESEWGSREFVRYYAFTGIGAGLTQWAVAMHSPIPVIGASGAIFGVILAFAMLFPDRPVYLYMVVPIPAKYLVVLFAVLELAAIPGGGGGVARFAHLGGLAFGFIYLKSERFTYPFRRWWGTRRRRIERKFREADEARRQVESDEINAILDKISREGMGSLTAREKKVLEEAARRRRAGKR